MSLEQAGEITRPVEMVSRPFSNQMSVGEWDDPFEPLKITMNDYYRSDCRDKSLHFFVPCSFELKKMSLESQKQSWKVIEFKSEQELPCYFKSIATPSGDIYLTGGS